MTEQTKYKVADITPESFISWLEQQVVKGRGNEPYEYLSNRNCLLAQYFKEHDFSDPVLSAGAVGEGVHPYNVILSGEPGEIFLLPGAKSFDDGGSVFNEISLLNRTFGGALTYAKDKFSALA